MERSFIVAFGFDGKIVSDTDAENIGGRHGWIIEDTGADELWQEQKKEISNRI